MTRNRLLDLGRVQRIEPRGCAKARIGDHDIRRSEHRLEPGNRGQERRSITHVGDRRRGDAAASADFTCHGLELGAATSDQADAAAKLADLEGQGSANAARCTRDDDRPRESNHAVVEPSVRRSVPERDHT